MRKMFPKRRVFSLVFLRIPLFLSPLSAEQTWQPTDQTGSGTTATNASAASKKSDPPADSAQTPAPAKPTATPAQSAKPAVQQTLAAKNLVWANTEFGVYHKPGTRWYGKIKRENA